MSRERSRYRGWVLYGEGVDRPVKDNKENKLEYSVENCMLEKTDGGST